jgi:hypothetical protein
VLTRVFFGVLLPVIAVIVAWILIRRGAPKIKTALAVVVPPLVIVGILGWIDDVKFGSPLLTGYHQWRPREHLLVGSWSEGLRGFLFSAHWSIFEYFPLLLISIWGTRAFWRRYPVDAAVMFGTFVVSLLILAKIPTWRGEWTYGPRYLIFVLPIMGMPALLVFERWKRLTVAAAILILLPSLLAQLEVNRADFWLFYRLYTPIQPVADGDIAAYFYGRPEAVLYYQMESHRDDLDETFVFQRLSRKITPRSLANYRKLAKEVMDDRNLYWFGPPGKTKAAF